MTPNIHAMAGAGKTSQRTTSKRLGISILATLIAAGLAFAFGIHAFGQSGADQQSGIGPDQVTIEHSEPFEEISGYIYAEATMERSFDRDDGSFGHYRVPLILIYPETGGNDVGIVDLPNSVFYSGTGFTIDDPHATLQLTRATTQGYVFDSGYTYASVQWNKEATDFFGDGHDGADENHLVSGSIEQASDAWKIIRDASAVLRDPDALLDTNDIEDAPQPVSTVLSSGYSQSGVILQSFLSEDQNERDGVLAYDGHLIGTGGFGCNAPLDVVEPVGPLWEPALCDLPHHDDSKVISIITEATVQFLGAPRFEEEPDNWRQYELAGVAHTNPAITPEGPLIVSDNRNPVVHVPVFRAAFDNLAEWAADGVPAPPSRLLEGEIDPETGALVPDVDEHGNALGGLRLPHMEQQTNGHDAGAPLGTYTGINPPYFGAFFDEPSFDAFAEILTSIAGTFEPFDETELEERYPNHGAYVNQVARAAAALYQEGYIVAEDRRAYVRDAAHSSGDRRGQGDRR